MILLILAAFAQAATGDAAASREALMVCAAATTEADRSEAAMVPVNYYLLSAVRADPRGRRLWPRLAELSGELHRYRARFGEGGAQRGRAEAVRAECDAQHPQARGTGPVNLPAVAGDRNILCYDMINFYRRLEIDPVREGLEPDRTQRAEEAYLLQLPGGDNATLSQRSAELMLASLDLGNIESISRACIAGLGETPA